MTAFTYSLPGSTDGLTAVLYVDPACTVPAAVTQLNGAPIPDSVVVAGRDGASFQSVSSPLYTPAPDGAVAVLSPALNFAAPSAVTGAKGSNAALASLIAALIAVGVPITDQTTA